MTGGSDTRGAGPLVSVVIPAYNAEDTLEATLASVTAQTYRNLQVIVVDDGSTDGTAALVECAARADGRISLVRKPNGGVASARNAALPLARGEYISWIDADDLWHPTKIERQIEIFLTSDPKPVFVYSGYRRIGSDDRIEQNHRPLSDISGRTFCLQVATNFFSNVSSIMVPAELVRRFGGHDERLRQWGMEGAEDLRLQLQLSRIGAAACCRQALVGYRIHRSNMSLGYKRAAQSNLRAIDLTEAESTGVPARVFAIGRARVIGYVPYLLGRGDWRGALRTFWRIFRRHPLECTVMCARMVGHVARDTFLGSTISEPEIGKLFLEANPETARWQRVMLLSRRQERMLADCDREMVAAGGGSGAAGAAATRPAMEP